MTEWTHADVDEYVDAQGLKREPVDHIVNTIVFKALKSWYADRDAIKQLLWDEKIDDVEGERLTEDLTDRTGSWIAAIYRWARGE